LKLKFTSTEPPGTSSGNVGPPKKGPVPGGYLKENRGFRALGFRVKHGALEFGI